MSKVFGLTSRYTPVSNETSRRVFAYGIEPVDDKNSTWFEVFFYKKQHPNLTLQDVKDAIYADVNAETDRRILEDFVWNDKPVWLSIEYQLDFKASYDFAVQTSGESLPVKFKLGETSSGEPVYHTFTDITEFTDFYSSLLEHINKCRRAGWELKDSIDWDVYKSFLDSYNGIE